LELGTSLGILAPNGTGKTTLINMGCDEQCRGYAAFYEIAQSNEMRDRVSVPFSPTPLVNKC
tara:strand:+ start:172 stop:357 length:186 start_codon:yes stop_codon:yes gene_type:complete